MFSFWNRYHSFCLILKMKITFSLLPHLFHSAHAHNAHTTWRKEGERWNSFCCLLQFLFFSFVCVFFSIALKNFFPPSPPTTKKRQKKVQQTKSKNTWGNWNISPTQPTYSIDDTIIHITFIILFFYTHSVFAFIQSFFFSFLIFPFLSNNILVGMEQEHVAYKMHSICDYLFIFFCHVWEYR